MPETRKKIRLLGLDVNVTDVPIKAAEESFNDYELEDGTKVRVKFSASTFMRADNEYAADGKPVYLVFSTPVVNVISAPEKISRPLHEKGN